MREGANYIFFFHKKNFSLPNIFPSESFPTSGCKGVQHSEAGMVRVGNMDRLGQVEGASLGSRGMFPSKKIYFFDENGMGNYSL